MFDPGNEVPNGCIQVRLRQDQLSRNTSIEGIGDDGHIPWMPLSMRSTPSEHMDESTHDLEFDLITINEKDIR